MSTPGVGKAKFTYEAGLLVKGQIEAQLRAEAFKHNVDITIKKFGGLLSSKYGVTVYGLADNVRKYTTSVVRWLKHVEEALED